MRGSDTTPALRDIKANTWRAKTTQMQMHRGVYELHPRELEVPQATPDSLKPEGAQQALELATWTVLMDHALTNQTKCAGSHTTKSRYLGNSDK